MPRGSRRLPDECVRLLYEADLILHAGDVTTAGVLDEFGELGRIEAVHGNADEPALRETLPERRVVEAGAARIGMIHDAGPRPGRVGRLLAAFPDCGVIVYGHSHLPEATRVGETWIVNPGSPTERRRGPFRSMALIRTDAPLSVEILALS
jgi:uncharacterized protein